MALSFNNVQGNNNNSTSNTTTNINQQAPKFEGSLYENAAKDLAEIGAGITTLIGGIFGYDKEARATLGNMINNLANNPIEGAKQFGDAMLSTYNLAIDDIGKMPLGEMVGNVMTGAWKHPISALLDVTSLTGALGLKMPKTLKSKIKWIDESDTRLRLAEEVTKDNLRLNNTGVAFIKQIDALKNKYSPEQLSKAMQAVETIGFKNAPKDLLPIMQDLTKANDTYKQFTSMAGAKIYDDIDFAAKELIAREQRIPFEEVDVPSIVKTDLYKSAVQYVKENDVRPLFHLSPKVDTAGQALETNLLKRKYGTIDYMDASKDIDKKAGDFVDKVIRSTALDSASNLNKKIREYNKVNGTSIKELDTSSSVFKNKFLNELNSELKKTMLSGGVYLGANVLSTTLSVLNNFDINAATKTFKNLPKFRMVELSEASTPILNYISKINNVVYRPIASVDRYIENIAAEYIKNYGLDKAKYMQSTIPSKVVATNPLESAVKTFVPFGSYPLAATKELVAHVQGRPIRSLVYNQIPKVGSDVNQQVQSQTPGIQEVDKTKVIRNDPRENKLVQRSTVVTPIQAANMFILGQQGDAIQIPLFTFLNKLISGEGDPSIFEVDGRKYKVTNGNIETAQGTFNLLPSLSYIGRNILSPVQFYNQVVVPLTTDKYIRDEKQLFNKLVNDAQYANLGTQAQKRVTTLAREKLGKRLAGTYEYNYYKPFVSTRVKKKIMQQRMRQDTIKRVLD